MFGCTYIISFSLSIQGVKILFGKIKFKQIKGQYISAVSVTFLIKRAVIIHIWDEVLHMNTTVLLFETCWVPLYVSSIAIFFFIYPSEWTLRFRFIRASSSVEFLCLHCVITYFLAWESTLLKHKEILQRHQHQKELKYNRSVLIQHNYEANQNVSNNITRKVIRHFLLDWEHNSKI